MGRGQGDGWFWCVWVQTSTYALARPKLPVTIQLAQGYQFLVLDPPQEEILPQVKEWVWEEFWNGLTILVGEGHLGDGEEEPWAVCGLCQPGPQGKAWPGASFSLPGRFRRYNNQAPT